MSIAEAIDAEAVPCVHERGPSAVGAYDVAGKWVSGAAVRTDTTATIQPATGRQLQDLPEGIRKDAQYLAWSRFPFALDDRIEAMGDKFRVVYVWPRPVDGFTRAAMGLIS